MATYGEFKQPRWNFIEMLRAELAWYPGRAALVGRIVLACTTVMVLAEVFRIPGAVLGASFPILISRESPQAARKSAFQIALACSIATVEIILGGMLTAGSPFLHVLWVMASLVFAFYAISILNFTPPGVTLSAVIAIAIQAWDYPVLAKVRVENTLYTLLLIVMGCLITALIEALLAKKQSPSAILDGISSRLGLVEAFLSRAHAQEFPPALTLQLSRSAAKGVDELSELLAHSHYEPGFHDLLATVIALTRQLVELGSNLAQSADTFSIDDRERCLAIARHLSSLRSCLLCKTLADWVALPLANRTANPILVEMERTVDLIVQSFSHESLPIHQLAPVAAPAVSVGDFVVGALQNKEHLKFAVRGALPALLCYVFHLSIGWMGGLAASIVTCTLTARRFTGATRHRQSLRSAGFILGAGVIGIGTEAFILPQIDSLLQYAMLFASVVWLGSWVATSGPRIAFSGFQIVIAYSLVNLNRFTINTSLVPSRDALLGIVLGVIAMWLVFDHLWAENSDMAARKLLLGTLRNLADLKAVAAEAPEEANQGLATTSSSMNRDFDKLRDLADMYAFESFPKKPNESLVNRSIRTLLPELRAFLFVKTGLLQHRNLAATKPDDLVRGVEEQASSVLHWLANAIEGEVGEPPSWNVRVEELRAGVQMEEEKARDRSDRQKDTEMRLCGSLLGLASHLEWRARLNVTLEAGAEAAVGDLPIEAAGHGD